MENVFDNVEEVVETFNESVLVDGEVIADFEEEISDILNPEEISDIAILDSGSSGGFLKIAAGAAAVGCAAGLAYKFIKGKFFSKKPVEEESEIIEAEFEVVNEVEEEEPNNQSKKKTKKIKVNK